MDAEPVGVRAGTAYAVYFRLRSLYAVLPGVDAVFDLAGGGVWMLSAHHCRNGHRGSRGMVQRLDCRIIKLLCRHCAAFSFCREVVKLAATRLIALHKNKGKSVAACLKSRTDYAQNPDKTQQGELVSSYECSPLTVDEEFMLSKRQYELMTGRRQKSDVIAYQIRQSFKPGEITAEEANKVGYELAMRFTKGKYAFIVATHTDRKHIHNHILYNSTALDSTRKFRDFLLSGLAVQRLSDLICLEHQLSVIEIKPYRERQKRTLYPSRESSRDKLCAVIDGILLNEKPASFEGFLQKLEQQGYEIKRGKHTSVKGARQKRFIRFRTLGAGYSEDEIKAVLEGKLSAFTGNTGVGKSSLLNNMFPALGLATNEISKKLGRGKHTTRHVELYKLEGGGYIADTPGFSSFDTNRYDIIFKDKLAGCFPEFQKYEGKCRFPDCSHTKEKGCAVIEAVKNGEIAKSRHESYVEMYEQAKQLKEWEYKND